MNCKDLRLDNVVLYKGVVVSINELLQTGCGVISADLSINCGSFYSTIEPIQLTDEILCEWCGFKISPCQGFYFDVDHELQIYITRNHAISLINRQDEGEHYLLRKIRFLHQLQNLYFALTGEELTVNIQKPVAQHIK